MGAYLVTGGGGFIGSHIAEALVKRGDTVRVLDDFSTGRRENLADLAGRVEVFEGDINDEALAAKAMAGVEVVFHEAALPSVPRSVADPAATNRACVDGTLSILNAARQSGVRRVVYAASSSAYGDQPGFPRVETMAPQPLSPYAAAKLAGEYYCQVFTRCYGLETVCLRYFNVFGPRQNPKSQYAAAIPVFTSLLLKGERPTIYGDGEQSRDWTYVANVVHANLLAAAAPKASGHVINVVCGDTRSVNEVVARINGFLDTKIEPLYAPARAGDVRRSEGDFARARELLGYRPQVSFEEGLRRTVEWFKTHPA
ncbi:MAG TPA: SDR family oxidoreductase [Candidatus Brocadiia bacterium]|nr:SDR family oxidoreductase [Candidatus Brocadiia bacterium]